MLGEVEWNSVGFFVLWCLQCGLSVDFLGAVFTCGYSGVRVAAFFEKLSISLTIGAIILSKSVKITDRFTCTSATVIYCITCTLCKKLYIGETGRRLGDRFREHLRWDVEKDDKDASKPVARHFNLPNHSKEHMSICGLSLYKGTTDSRKNLEQRFIFQIGTPTASTNAFHSINLFLFFA